MQLARTKWVVGSHGLSAWPAVSASFCKCQDMSLLLKQLWAEPSASEVAPNVEPLCVRKQTPWVV